MNYNPQRLFSFFPSLLPFLISFSSLNAESYHLLQFMKHYHYSSMQKLCYIFYLSIYSVLSPFSVSFLSSIYNYCNIDLKKNLCSCEKIYLFFMYILLICVNDIVLFFSFLFSLGTIFNVVLEIHNIAIREAKEIK